MRNQRVLVQRAPDAVAYELTHSREAVRFRIGLNSSADITQAILRAGLFNAEFHAATSNIQQFLRCAIYSANGVCRTRIADPALIQHADIDADDIALLQLLLLTWDAMTNDIVDRSTNSARKGRDQNPPLSISTTPISFINGGGTSTTNKVLGDTIKFSRRNSWFDIRAEHFKCFRNQPPGFA